MKRLKVFGAWLQRHQRRMQIRAIRDRIQELEQHARDARRDAAECTHEMIRLTGVLARMEANP